MLAKVRNMFAAIARRFHSERDLDAHLRNVAAASIGVVQAKQHLDHVIADAFNDDQFRAFADGARKARF